MPTRGQILVELERRGELPAKFRDELAGLKAKGDQQFLSSLPAERAALVQAIAEGRTKPPTPGIRNMALLQDVATYKPGYNAADAAAQNAGRVDLAKGDLGKNIRSLNTAIGHLGSLSDDVAALGNTTSSIGLTQIENSLKNRFAAGSGGVAQRQFGVDRQAVADELETAFRGGRGGTLAGTKGWEGNINLNDAPAQQRAAIQAAAHLLQSRIDAIGDQYGQAMRTSADGLTLLSPKAQDAMRRFTDAGFVGGGTTIGGVPANYGGRRGGGHDGPAALGNGVGGPDPPNPFNGGDGGGDALSVAQGPTRRISDPDVARQVGTMIRAGRSTDDINAAFPGRTFPADQIATVRQWLADHPGYKGPLNIQAFHDEPTTRYQRVSGGPLAAAVASSADAVIPFGLINSGLKQQLDAAKATHPGAALAGAMLGGIPAAAGFELGAARMLPAAGKWVPRIADAAYGAYTGAGDADPDQGWKDGIIGGVTGGVLGAAGRQAARTVGTAARGVGLDDAVQLLRDRGVPLTVGQTVGGFVKRQEDRLAGVPFVGEVVRNRRREGLSAFNSAAFDEGLTPLGGIPGYAGATTTGGVIGEQGVDLARSARSQGYGAALDGVNVTADAPFASDMLAASRAGQQLPDPMRGNAAATINMRVGNSLGVNVGPQGQLSVGLTGNDFQQAVRGLRRDTKAVASLPYGHDFGQVTGQAEDALTGLLDRQAPGAVPAYNTANEVNRNVEVLRDAVDRARNGSRTGMPGAFSPSQLIDAASANAKRFGGTHGTTDQPFYDLARAGQDVLPSSVPDAGTAGRLALLALPGSLAAAGGVGGYASGETGTGSEVGLGAGALLSMLGSRGAQRGILSLLADRPDVLRRLGSSVYDNAHLAALPAVAASAPAVSLLAPR